MADFVSWTAELARFKNALANQKPEALLQSGYTDARGQTVTFKKWKDVMNWLDRLETKAAAEALPGGRRRMTMTMGAGGVD